MDAQAGGWCEHYASKAVASRPSFSGEIVSATQKTRQLRSASSMIGTVARDRVAGRSAAGRVKAAVLDASPMRRTGANLVPALSAKA